MRVILNTTDDKRFATVIAQHIGKVCMHFVPQNLIGKKRKTIFS